MHYSLTPAASFLVFFAQVGDAKPPTAAQSRASASAEQEVTALERDSWRAWQEKDVAFWQRHLSADHVEMDGAEGPTDKSFVVQAIASRKCAVTSYDLADFTFRQLDPDTALLVYRATQKFDCVSGPQTGWITSLYERRAGRWENVLFEHFPVQSQAPKKSQ